MCVCAHMHASLDMHTDLLLVEPADKKVAAVSIGLRQKSSGLQVHWTGLQWLGRRNTQPPGAAGGRGCSQHPSVVLLRS